MSRVQAALDDLARLSRELHQLEQQLGPWPAQLGAAIDAAWATSGSFLGLRSDLDQVLTAQQRMTLVTAEATERAADRLALAGSDRQFLRMVPLGSLESPAARMAGLVVTRAGTRLADDLGQWLARQFQGPNRAQPTTAYVVRTSVEVYKLSAVVEVELRYVREELSDGSVRLTEVYEVAGGVGIGIGASCQVKADGTPLFQAEAAASASVGLWGASGRTWIFADINEADSWWDKNGDRLRAEKAAALTLPGGGWAVSASNALRRRMGKDGDLASDEQYQELGVAANAEARLSGADLNVGGLAEHLGLAVSGFGSGTIRLNRDGTSTITVAYAAEASAGYQIGLGNPFPAHPATDQATANANANITVDVTVSASGQLQELVIRSTTLDEAGLDQSSVRSALDLKAASASVGSTEQLHVYEAAVSLDLTNPVVRDMVEHILGQDLDKPGAQVQAALAALTFDPRLLVAATVTVVERTPLDDRLWAAGCDIDLPVLKGKLGLTQGTATQETVATWEKVPGQTTLTRFL